MSEARQSHLDLQNRKVSYHQYTPLHSSTIQRESVLVLDIPFEKSINESNHCVDEMRNLHQDEHFKALVLFIQVLDTRYLES